MAFPASGLHDPDRRGVAMHQLSPRVINESRRLSESPSPPPSPAPAAAQIATAGGTSRHTDPLLPTSSVHMPSKLDRLRLFVRSLRKKRIFVYLTIMSGVMFTVNILQIVLIEHFHGRGWMIVFPTVVFIVMTAVLLVWMVINRRGLLESWHDTDRAKRLAGIGACLSILLPILSCEFLYMNLVALPAYHTKIWTTTLTSTPSVPPPSFAFVEVLDWTATGAYAHNISQYCPPNFPELPCVADPKVVTTSCCGELRYEVFDGSKLGYNLTVRNGIGFLADLTITNPTGSGLNNKPGDPGQLYFTVFDPRLEDRFVEALDCGILTLDGYPTQSSVVLNLEKYNIDDDVLAVNWTENGDCNKEYFSHYSAFRYEMTQLDWDSSLRNVSACTANWTEFVIQSCLLETSMGLSTQTVVTQTSERGTDWKQMLLDEGSIVGGITFVTWFLGIYII